MGLALDPITDTGEPARHGGAVHVVRAPDLVDRQLVHEVHPQHDAIARVEVRDRFLDRCLEHRALLGLDHRDVGTVSFGGEQLEQRSSSGLVAMIAALQVQRGSHRRDPDQPAEIAAACHVDDPSGLPGPRDEQPLTQDLEGLVGRIATEPHPCERGASAWHRPIFDPSQRHRVATRAAEREPQILDLELVDGPRGWARCASAEQGPEGGLRNVDPWMRAARSRDARVQPAVEILCGRSAIGLEQRVEDSTRHCGKPTMAPVADCRSRALAEAGIPSARMACLDDGTVLALVEGRLADATHRTAETHLDVCPSCLALVATAVRALGLDPLARARSASRFAANTDRYELGPEIARGGMGRIHEAFDRRLGRHVAIKCALHDSPALVERFAREVELTSRLEHPAIVPIHDSGTLRDGTAFYAMRLVVGQPLDRLIGRTLAQRLAFVRNLIIVADAVAYAHARGVIHRDLKPQNILVGEFGETVLLDWGLAKELSSDEADDAATERTAATGVTAIHGEVLGTRGYMAPEQAAGESVGFAADVYGLGATLYHVLTGIPPDAAPADGLAPATPGIPPDLVAIVRRATAQAPSARYPSAKELAADLHRFEAGRLVEARRYTTRQLVVRWLARHRAVAAIAAIAVIVVAGLSIAGLRQIFAERDAAMQARTRAETQREAAEEVIGFVVGGLRDRLEKLGRLDLLTDASSRVVDYYGRLGHSEDSGALAFDHHLGSLQMLGEAHKAAGRVPAALDTFREQLALARVAATRNRAAESQVCWALVRLGQAQRFAGKVAESDASFRECAELVRRTSDARDTESWQRVIAAVTVELAQQAYARRDLREARRLASELFELGKRAFALGRPWGDPAAAKASLLLTQWAMEDADWPAARRAATDQVEISLRIAAGDPEAMAGQHNLAVAKIVAGEVKAHDGDLVGAAADYEAGRTILTALIAREPNNALFGKTLADVELTLGTLATTRGDSRGALVLLQASRNRMASLAVPDNPDRTRDLAVRDSLLGSAHVELGDRAAARASFQRSVEGFERVVALAPSELAAINELGGGLFVLGDFELDSGNRVLAQTLLERSLALARTVLTAQDSRAARFEVAQRLALLAKAHPADASRSLDEAAEVAAQLRPQAAGRSRARRVPDRARWDGRRDPSSPLITFRLHRVADFSRIALIASQLGSSPSVARNETCGGIRLGGQVQQSILGRSDDVTA